MCELCSQMLQHPWILGDTASSSTIAGSEKRLKRFTELREKLEAGIFAVIISAGSKTEERISKGFSKGFSKGSKIGGAAEKGDGQDGQDGQDGPDGQGEPVTGSHRIISRAYELMDTDHKGFVSSDDMARVLTSEAGISLSENEKRDMNAAVADTATEKDRKEQKGMDFHSFSNLMSNLNTVYFAKGQKVFLEGEKGESMYFINSGKVVFTLNGTKLGTLGQGDFFGEGR